VFLDFQFEKEEYRVFEIEDVKKWLSFTAKSENKVIGEIVFHFVSEERILEVNQEYLNHDYFTDIITFDDSFVNIINGSIFISPDTVKYNSQILNISFSSEIHRVIVHGIMHLCGYKDSNRDEKIKMRKLEDKYLHYLEKL
jgi:probable rRNA maturation factor